MKAEARRLQLRSAHDAAAGTRTSAAVVIGVVVLVVVDAGVLGIDHDVVVALDLASSRCQVVSRAVVGLVMLERARCRGLEVSEAAKPIVSGC